MTNELNIVGSLSCQYSDRPLLQALLQLVPGWSSADTLLQRRANEIKSERLKVFFHELSQGNQELTEELIQTEDFLHSYFCTLRAAINTRRREKIKIFAELLDSSLNVSFSVGPDEYEELLKVLDEISFREFKALKKLYESEKSNPIQENQNQLQNAQQYWQNYKREVSAELGIPDESFNAFMAKIERTGLYTRITGNYLGYAGDIGRTTPLLRRLIDLIENDPPTSCANGPA